MRRLATTRANAINVARLTLAIPLLLVGCASQQADIHGGPLRTRTNAATSNPPPSGRQTAFYVSSHGWHTSIIVPRAAIPTDAWPAGVLDREFRDFRYIEAGWGDRKFYMAPRPNVSTAFDAVFFPGASVLHVVGLDPPVSSAFAWSGLVQMPCTAAELRNLSRAIGASFEADMHQQVRALGRGLYGRVSRFYPARGQYYFANTCNTWTARMMRAGGFPANAGPVGTWTAGAVMAQARRLAKERSSKGTASPLKRNDQRVLTRAAPTPHS